MKKIIVLFCACVVLAVAAQAQTAPATSYVTVSGNFVAFNSTSSMTASSDIGAALQLFPSLSAGYNQITVPGISRTYRLGVLNYSKPLSSFLGKKLSDKFVFDVSQIILTVQAGAGKVSQTANGSNPVFNTIAETAGIDVSYSLNSHLSWSPVGVHYLHGGVHPSSAVYTTGFNFHF